MGNFSNRFEFEMDLRGARVVATRDPICSFCVTDSEVDYQIEAMKANLDEVGKQMKSAIKFDYPKIPLYPDAPNAERPQR